MVNPFEQLTKFQDDVINSDISPDLTWILLICLVLFTVSGITGIVLIHNSGLLGANDSEEPTPTPTPKVITNSNIHPVDFTLAKMVAAGKIIV